MGRRSLKQTNAHLNQQQSVSLVTRYERTRAQNPHRTMNQIRVQPENEGSERGSLILKTDDRMAPGRDYSNVAR